MTEQNPIKKTQEGLPVVTKKIFHRFLDTMDSEFNERAKKIPRSNPEVASYIGSVIDTRIHPMDYSKREHTNMVHIYSLLDLQAMNDGLTLPRVNKATLEVFVRDHPENPSSAEYLRRQPSAAERVRELAECRDWEDLGLQKYKGVVKRYMSEVGGENPVIRDYIHVMRNQPEIYWDELSQSIAMRNMASVYLLLKAQARQDKIDGILLD